jgi:hypothetical protein
MSFRPARAPLTLFRAAALLGPVTLLATRAAPTRRLRKRPADAAADGTATTSTAGRPGTTVPDLIGRHVLLVDKLAGDAGVVPILSYRPRARQAPGTVVAVHPAAGSAVGRGSTIQVAVAGRPGTDLGGRIAADRRRFIGLGADPDGTLVVVVAAGVNPEAAVAAIRPALAGRKHRVVTADTTFAELESVRAGVSAVLLRASGYTLQVDAAACAVRVEGDIPPEVAATLTERYGRAVVVDSARPTRRSA